MKIVFDARMINGQKHGIGRYAEEVLGVFASSIKDDELVLLVSPGRPEKLNSEFSCVETDIPMYSMQEHSAIPVLLKKLGADLYYLPSYNAPVECPCKFIFTIYDLIHLRYPESLLKKFRNKLYYHVYVGPAAKRADAVVTISETSKKDIVEMLGVPEEKLSNCGVGISETFHSVRERETDSPNPRPYLLSVSNAKRHKDTITLVKAYQTLVIQGQIDMELVLIGNQHKEVEEIALDSDGRMKILTGLDDEAVARWMKHAELFVFTSLYEGFGLPPLEALACGTPVVSSDSPALKEALGECAFYYSTGNCQSLSEVVTGALNDKSSAAKVQKGIERARAYSWDKVGKEVFDLINCLKEGIV